MMEEKDKGEIILGIDLGTTYSCAAVYRYNPAENNTENGYCLHDKEIIKNIHGRCTIPSQVGFTSEKRLIGDDARNQAVLNCQNTIYGAKRLIGRRYSDPSIQDDLKILPFKVVEGAERRPKIEVTFRGKPKTYYPEQISAMILTEVKKAAEEHLEKEVSKVVITVPARFNDSQRQATKDAARIAGLTVIRIINEPTAAALAYGLNCMADDEQKIVLVFDLGGGTFDISILRIHNGEFKVLATDGDTHLGGEDFDNKLVEHFAKEFERKNGVDIRGDKKAMARIKIEVEKAKRQLSASKTVQVEVDALHGGINLSEKLTREKFESLCAGYLKHCIEKVKDCLTAAGTEKSKVDEIVMVGGSTRIPMVQKMVSDFFGGKQLCKRVNPDEVVAQGAAVQAEILSQRSSKKLDNVVLLDVTPLSLGTDVEGDLMSIVVPRNSPIPIKKTEVFFTVRDNQTAIKNQIYEGERARASENNLLGKFTLKNLPPRPRREVKEAVTFEIDEDGILKVSALHEETGNRESITLTNNGRLPDKEIERMIEEAKQYEEQDRAYRARAKARNDLLDYAYSMRKEANADSGSLKQRDKDRILKAASRVIEWVEANPDASKETYEMERQKLQSNRSSRLGWMLNSIF